MQAMSQTQVKKQHDKIVARFEANQQLAELEAEQVYLKIKLSRFDIHKEAVGQRTIPDYVFWLPFSKNGRHNRVL